MNADTIATGRRLEEAATKGHWMVYDSCSFRRIGLTGDYHEILWATQYRDGCLGIDGRNCDNDLAALLWLRNHARDLLAAAEKLEAILSLARKYANPGANPGAHGLSSQILRIAGERPERSE